MKVETFSYTKSDGWSVSAFPKVDHPEKCLIFIFASPIYEHDPGPIIEVSKKYPGAVIAGCSTAGEILQDRVLDESIVVAVVEFDRTEVKLIAAPVTSASDSFSAGEMIGQQLNDDELRSVILISDGISVNGSQLVYGINSTLSDSVIVTGGLSGDGDRFERTWVIEGAEINFKRVLGIGLYGSAIVTGFGAEGGWDIFGAERVVTKAEKSVVYEIDHKPALQLYKEYLGNRAAELPASALLFPLSIKRGERNNIAADGKPCGGFLVRTILSVNEEDQSMQFAGDIEEGSVVQLMKANYERLVFGASQAAEQAAFDFPNEDEILSIAISCVGRRLVLGERTDEELEAVLQKLPSQTNQVGFYSYGEISPQELGYCDLHNQTMTLILLTERKT